MFRFIIAALFGLLIPLTAAQATERSRIGYGRLITNDIVGDRNDRWRTGSSASSRVWGPEWSGQLPNKFGDLIELRLGAEIISPVNLRAFNTNDRRYGSSITVGVHSHYLTGKTEVAAGLDLVVVGPQTGLSEFQSELHDLFNVSEPSNAVLRNQIANSIEPTLALEMGRSFDLSDRTHIRPFVEARAGVETYVRAGFDLTFGDLGRGELLVRDTVAGHRYQTIAQDWSGFSTVIGADIAAVGSSVFLPENRGPQAKDTRVRVRAGGQWQGKDGKKAFYGLTYLGEEFEGQAGGQVIGSARVNFKF